MRQEWEGSGNEESLALHVSSFLSLKVGVIYSLIGFGEEKEGRNMASVGGRETRKPINGVGGFSTTRWILETCNHIWSKMCLSRISGTNDAYSGDKCTGKLKYVSEIQAQMKSNISQEKNMKLHILSANKVHRTNRCR